MNKQIKKDWLRALRGGQYKQTKRALKNENNYCCLGVLCDLHAKVTGEEWEMFSYSPREHYLGEEAALPNEVMDWAELNHKNPKYFGGYGSLAQANDGGKNFKQIANIIDKHF